MKPRHKKYLKINLVSLVFIVVSFMSVTLAWFAYSGLSKVSTEVGVKAWYIELEKDGQAVSNDVVISLDDISPGMNTVNETVKVKNLGDSDAQVDYSIVSARVLGAPEDNYVVNVTTTTSPYVEDILSHNYPFHININLSRNYVLSKGTESIFNVSLSWPLDSGTDEFDTLWGNAAYEFEQNEAMLKGADPNYQVRPSIQVVISLKAEQYLQGDNISDPNYNLGDQVLFDVANNTACSEVNQTCLKTHIIDVNNVLGNHTVTLLPDSTGTYQSGNFNNYNTTLSSITNGWTATARSLQVGDILKPISTDITKSLLVRGGLSDSIIGNLNYNNRINTEINKAISYNGYYKFLNDKFNYFSSTNCYWVGTEYNTTNGFAIKAIDETNSKLYGENKTTSCKVIPVIIANKSSL